LDVAWISVLIDFTMAHVCRRPAGNHPNPCGTQTYEASLNFDEMQTAARQQEKSLSSLLHKRRENGSMRFNEFQMPRREMPEIFFSSYARVSEV
jgi:hypothetical protein